MFKKIVLFILVIGAIVFGTIYYNNYSFANISVSQKPDVGVDVAKNNIKLKTGKDLPFNLVGTRDYKSQKFYYLNDDKHKDRYVVNTKDGQIEAIYYNRSFKVNKITETDGLKIAKNIVKNFYKEKNIDNYRLTTKPDHEENVMIYRWEQYFKNVKTPNYVQVFVNLNSSQVQEYQSHYEDIMINTESKISKENAINEAIKYAELYNRKYTTKDVEQADLILGNDNNGVEILKWQIKLRGNPTNEGIVNLSLVEVNAITGQAFHIMFGA